MSDNKKNKFYTCRYDRAFKEVMTKLSNRDILKLILEKVLGVKIRNIKINNVERNSGNIKIRRKNVDALLWIVNTYLDKLDVDKFVLHRRHIV